MGGNGERHCFLIGFGVSEMGTDTTSACGLVLALRDLSDGSRVCPHFEWFWFCGICRAEVVSVPISLEGVFVFFGEAWVRFYVVGEAGFY